MIRIQPEPFWFLGPDPANVFVRGQPVQGLQSAGVVVGDHEQVEVVRQLLMAVVVISFDGGVLDGAVHPFDLPVGPGMVRFGQPVLDAVLTAEPVEQMHAELRRGSGSITRRVAELDAIVSQHGVDAIRYRLDHGIQERHGALPVGNLRQTGDSELRSSVDGNEQVELALSGTHLGNVEMEEADRIET